MSRIEKALEKASQLRQRVPDISLDLPASNQISQSEPCKEQYPIHPQNRCINNALLVSANGSGSPIAEEYKKLKSNLIGLVRQGSLSNVIMVTSSIAGEGKSITALNLALSLAQEIDHTVLLIDADLRKPSAHKYLEIEHDCGLAEVLENKVEISNALVHTGIGRLVLMPAGTVSQNPVELFTSQRLTQIIKEIKNRYQDRFVIIDTPPILPFAETRTLSRLVDGVIFVVKERLASQATIAEGLLALEGANNLGIVYNEASICASDDRYGHYYNKHYQQNIS
ncbi:XrtA-associated tyrosine autokinase [Geobacter pelophilus]|uniref:non-specific protein-tyrosine kinase n=1 Tax=Geoanaerobacter pelophilus TaxID=60036 RepID=A0AAW4KVQ0_9BACT|nr:XrtA-associated tyrosine autokinase [Geoanaerobacter pelophilus]MBT0662734.1 XrtA-associated tyrosine autokinase [Geoanaerobacter pelophilus]